MESNAKGSVSAVQVLFQDNTKDSPAAKQPQHYSGAYFTHTFYREAWRGGEPTVYRDSEKNYYYILESFGGHTGHKTMQFARSSELAVLDTRSRISLI